jgi:adenylate cyclase class 2
MIEVERKFRLTAEQSKQIKNRLEVEHGVIDPLHQVDEVFLPGMDSFATFKMGMPITRIREQQGTAKLAYKRQLNVQGDMLEHELGIESADIMRAILLELGYQSVVRVDKVRKEVKLNNIAIALDKVEGLGSFLEIEVMVDDEKAIVEAEKLVTKTAAQFGLAKSSLESRKYDQLVKDLQNK